MNEPQGYEEGNATKWTGSLINDGLTPWQNWWRLIRELVNILRGDAVVVETWVLRTGIRIKVAIFMRAGRIEARWNVPDAVLEVGREWWKQNHHILN